MLYLAEVKKQVRGFMGGFKTDLKLLACQHNDQTWSAIGTDEFLTADNVDQVGEGALLILNLNQNRQMQGKPEPAGPELVRQLQKLSRLSEKLKDQREEIDQWKQSLTYQSQELSRREMEIEGRLEQLEEMESELQQVERRRQEIEALKAKIAREQQQIETFKNTFGDLIDLPSDRIRGIRELAGRISLNGHPPNWSQSIASALRAAVSQQDIFNHYWQELDENRAALNRKNLEIDRHKGEIDSRKQELAATQQSLAEAKVQYEVQKNILESKQELHRQLSLTRQKNEEMQICSTVTP